MPHPRTPTIPFLSLFVDHLPAAARRYEARLGIPPLGDGTTHEAPLPHPFAGSSPIVFDLGAIRLALYAADAARGTHQGDVGIGLALDDRATILPRLRAAQGVLLSPPASLPDGRTLAVAMLPDRHFFEVVAKGG